MADGLQDAPRHAGQVVRRVLLRRNIAIDAETAQLVADAVQAALRADAPSRPPRRRRRVPPPAAPLCSDLAGVSFLAPGSVPVSLPSPDSLTDHLYETTRRRSAVPVTVLLDVSLGGPLTDPSTGRSRC